ncbi:aminotransferase class IV [Nocardioides sp.]|uniref:aminotransferase class IV n=1 Tax=Nocardioides sp. TaxID=35761 RepID=UPI003517E463
MATTYTLDGDPVDAVPPTFALYPYGVFTTLVVEHGATLGWAMHEQRLARGAEELWGHRLDVERLRGVLRAHLAHLARTSGAPAQSVRITLFPDGLTIAAPERADGARALIASTPVDPPGVEDGGFVVQAVEHTRGTAHLKTTDLFAQLAIKREVRLAGADDALLVHRGTVLEGLTWTLLLCREGELVVPEGPALPSITAHHLAAIARTWGWTTTARPVLLDDLVAAGARLVLAVNANHPLRALTRVGERDLPLDADLLARFAAGLAGLPRHGL